MNYKLFSKTVGIKKITEIVSFSTEFLVRDFCFIENDFYFIHGPFIGKISRNKVNLNWSGSEHEENYADIDNSSYLYPSSMFYHKNTKKMYLVENAGRKIRCIEMLCDFETNVITNDLEKDVNYIFSKSPVDANTSIFVDYNGIIYWTSDIVNRCFVLENNTFNIFAGNGRAGYSTFNAQKECMLNFPVGIVSLNNKIFITDTGNNCIRCSQDKLLKTIFNVSNPRNIKIFGKKLIFISNDYIKSFTEDGKIINVDLYQGENIVSIDSFGSDLFIMENKSN